MFGRSRKVDWFRGLPHPALFLTDEKKHATPNTVENAISARTTEVLLGITNAVAESFWWRFLELCCKIIASARISSTHGVKKCTWIRNEIDNGFTKDIAEDVPQGIIEDFVFPRENVDERVKGIFPRILKQFPLEFWDFQKILIRILRKSEPEESSPEF